MRKHVLIPLVVSLLTSACGGDPRNAFVGVWELSGTVAVSDGKGDSTTQPINAGSWRISASATSPSEISWNTNGCDWSAVVTTEESFKVNRNVCPPLTENGCTYTVTVTQGTGTRAGTNLMVGVFGTTTGACAGGTTTYDLNYALNGARKN